MLSDPVIVRLPAHIAPSAPSPIGKACLVLSGVINVVELVPACAFA